MVPQEIIDSLAHAYALAGDRLGCYYRKAARALTVTGATPSHNHQLPVNLHDTFVLHPRLLFSQHRPFGAPVFVLERAPEKSSGQAYMRKVLYWLHRRAGIDALPTV